jgi:2-hydroxychromene-2-carboxylate isomerase
MHKPRVRVYTDYKSPYAFVANKQLFELEENHGVELEWLPYTLRIAEFMGTVEQRSPHFWRKVRYAYIGRTAPRQCTRAHHEGAAAHLRCVLFQRRPAVRTAARAVPALP